MSALKALFHPEVLLPTYNRMVGENPTPLFDKLFTNPVNTAIDQVRIARTPLNRTPAPLNNRNAPARVLSLIGADDAKGAMFHSFDMITMSPTIFMAVQELDSSGAVSEIASEELNRQMEAFSQRHAMQQEVAMSQFLTTGQVVTDPQGDFKASAATGDTTADFGIPSDHKGNLGGLIATDWDNSAAKILTQLENIDIEAAELGVPAPMLMVANSTLKPYLRENTEAADWVKASYNAADRALNGGFVPGLFGKDWLFIDSYWTDATGTSHKHIPDNVVVMLPNPVNARGWLRCMNGLELVPTTRDLVPNMNSAKAKFSKQYGRFSYAALDHNPARLDVFMGNNFGWMVAEPNALWIATIAS